VEVKGLEPSTENPMNSGDSSSEEAPVRQKRRAPTSAAVEFDEYLTAIRTLFDEADLAGQQAIVESIQAIVGAPGKLIANAPQSPSDTSGRPSRLRTRTPNP
jgi:hypothetical protein